MLMVLDPLIKCVFRFKNNCEKSLHDAIIQEYYSSYQVFGEVYWHGHYLGGDGYVKMLSCERNNRIYTQQV